MRAILEVMRFEIGYQLRSPFFLGALVMYALIHFLAITGTGINIDISNQVAINSTNAILIIELVLFIFGILPVMAFVTTAITRDFEYETAPLLFVIPVSPKMFVLGRFLGALIPALLIGLAGLLGSMVGTFMPWLDQARIAPFSLTPWTYIFFVFILPGTFVLCAIFFSIAALTRSFALTYGAAMAFFVADLLLNAYAMAKPGGWVAIADPSARTTVAAETLFWTAAELNTKIPVGLLPQNRLVWLSAALLVLLFLLLRFRLDLADNTSFRFRRRSGRTAAAKQTTQPLLQNIAPVPRFSLPASLAQFVSQLKMDLSCIFKGPLIYIILALEIMTLYGEFQGNVPPFWLDYSFYPLTSLMIPFIGLMIQFVLLVGIWYSAELIYRERASGIGEIVNASPYPDWLMILSKSTALCLVVNALMLAAVLTLMTLQAASGYTDFEPGLYLQSAFIYSGIYFCMLCTLAVVIQAILPNKWLGMLTTLCVYIGLLCLPVMGFDHPLYNFFIPNIIYSDMNGFGHFIKPVLSLIGYWGAFCVLLIIAAHLFYPRGYCSALSERLSDARTRLGAGVWLTTGLAAAVFIAVGGWIFYNTNILNEYLMPGTRLERRADYEITYGRYADAPSPSYDSIDMAVDIFPEERRLESRGSAILGNHKKVPIHEFVVSLNPDLHVKRIEVENSVLLQSDKMQGFYLYSPDTALAPGDTVKISWDVTRTNEGFTTNPDSELVANGSYISNFGVMPIPGYNTSLRITDIALRRKYGLPPVPRMPALGDPAHSDRLALGVDSRASFEIVLSTSADQIAVAPGRLLKDWRQGGRRYFHYRAEEPILPNLSFCSARFKVARDRWKNVELEIYYDPKHPFNIPAMMETAKRALEYYSREFAPYQYSYLRILEYARYRTAAQFQPGVIPYSEAIGFVTDLRKVENVDSGVLHELAHMWWADRITGAQMQGRWMLTESMAEYCRLMFFKEFYSPVYANKIAQGWHDGYLAGRKTEDEAEVPVMYTENHAYLRGKGPLVMYTLQDIIGKEKVHRALRNFLDEYSFQTSPCPTSRDLVNALRSVAGPEYQQLITDLFERILLYDLRVDGAVAREIDGGYEVSVEVTAKQFMDDGHGNETEESLDSWFDVAVFPETEEPLEEITPLYIQKHRLHSGKQVLTIHTSEKPGIVALDPFHKRIERYSGSTRILSELSSTGSRSPR